MPDPSRNASPVWMPGPSSALRFEPKPDRASSVRGRIDLDAPALQTMQAYRAGAGLARGDEAVAQARRGHGADVVQLARWIVKRRVLLLEWRGQSWLPCFQFHWPEVRLRDELAPVFTELVPVCTPWALGHWFVRPHAALGDQRPVDVLPSDAAAVLAAARLDRVATPG